jgi:GT2 family glycosyltransferase
MNVSLVICTKDRPYYLEETLVNIFLHENGLKQVIIVDASKDNKTQEIVENFQRKNRTRIIYKNCSPGLPKQKNLGIEIAFNSNISLDAITFLDDDILVKPDYFLQLQSFILENPTWTAFTGVSLTNKRVKASIARRLFYLDSKKDASILKSGICTPIYRDTDLSSAEWMPGASMTINPQILQYEKFNESMPIYYEDTEMSIRLNRHGSLQICHAMTYEHSQAHIGHASRKDVTAFSDGVRWVVSKNSNNKIKKHWILWSVFGSSLKALFDLAHFTKNESKKEILFGHLTFIIRLVLRQNLVSVNKNNEQEHKKHE